MPIEFVSYSALKADAEHTEDEDYRKAFQWLENEIGFYPHFLAFGNEEAEALTGYSNQWGRILTSRWENGKTINTLRAKGDNWNTVLFVFQHDAITDPVYTDYSWWCCLLNATQNDNEPLYRERRGCFRQSWSETDWVRLAHRKPCDVQVLTSVLDLRKACEVWVRNAATRKKLLSMGFSNVIVKRLPILESRWKKRDAEERAAKRALKEANALAS